MAQRIAAFDPTMVLCVARGTNDRLTALRVAPHATPTTMFESTYGVIVRAAERAGVTA